MGLQSNIQIRTFDYKFELKAEVFNRASSILVPDGRAIVDGFKVEIDSPTRIRVKKGIAVKERVIIEYTQDLELEVNTSLDVYLFVVLSYNFQQTCPKSEALIHIIRPSEYDPSSDLIINILRIDNNEVVNVLDCYPLDHTLCREDITLIDEKIQKHDQDPNSHPDIRAMIGGGTVDAPTSITLEAGETITTGDPVVILNEKVYKATNVIQGGNLSLVNAIGVASNDAEPYDPNNPNNTHTIKVITLGKFQYLGWNFNNASTPLTYLGDYEVTDNPPAAGAVVIIGNKITNNEIFVKPQLLYIR